MVAAAYRDSERTSRKITRISEDLRLVSDFVQNASYQTQSVSQSICDEIAEIGRLLHRVSERAIQVVMDTHGELSSVALERNRASLSDSILQTMLLVNQQLDWVVSKVSKQERLAREAVERCQKLQLVARALRRLSFQSHLLAINAKVSAAHIGDRGDAIAVIADEIDRLNSSVNRVCDDIGRFSSALSSGLEALCQNSAQISAVTREFATALHGTIENARQQHQNMDVELAHLLNSGGSCLNKLQQAAQDAEEHLSFGPQFQLQLNELTALLQTCQAMTRVAVERAELNARLPLKQ